MRKMNPFPVTTPTWLNRPRDASCINLLVRFCVSLFPWELWNCLSMKFWEHFHRWKNNINRRECVALVHRMAPVVISIRAPMNLRRPLYLYHPFISALWRLFINSDTNNQERLCGSGEWGGQPGTAHLINVTTGGKRWSLLPGRFIAWVKANYFLLL